MNGKYHIYVEHFLRTWLNEIVDFYILDSHRYMNIE